MSNTTLLVKLRELHEELASINDDKKSFEEIDDETIDALGELVSDVSEVVDKAKVAHHSDDDVDEHHDLRDRIQQFENAHPSVTRFLSQLTDLLGMMGI